jgi:hypothetical protein
VGITSFVWKCIMQALEHPPDLADLTRDFCASIRFVSHTAATLGQIGRDGNRSPPHLGGKPVALGCRKPGRQAVNRDRQLS